MPQLARHLLLIVAVSATVLLTNLGAAQLWDRDEPRNAGCAAEMLERGDWVTPVFNGELRIHKPVLLYWFMMTAYSLFGVNEFSARFWSALLGIGTVLQTYFIARRLFNPRAALWAAIVLSTALMFDVASRAATPDSVFMFFTTLSATIYVLATFRRRESDDDVVEAPQLRVEGQWFPQSWVTAAAMYAAMGIAILAKGPVGLVIPTAVLGMFLLIVRLPQTDAPAGEQRTWTAWLLSLIRPFAPLHFLKTCWYMRPVTAVLVALAVALPWYVWVGWRTDGDFIRGFLLEHNLGRAMRPMEGHGGPILYYPAAILMGFFPWSVFLFPMLAEAVRRIYRRHPWTTGYLLAACWVGVYVVLFSFARTKLPSYVTPCYPGLALLGGCFVFHWSRGQSIVPKFWQIFSLAMLAVVGLSILIAIPFVARVFLPGEHWLALLGIVPLSGAIVGLTWLLKQRYNAAALTMGATAFAFVLAMFGWCTVRVDSHQSVQALLSRVPNVENVKLGALGCLEPSWVFYSGQTIHEVHLPRKRPQTESAPARKRVVYSQSTDPDHVPVHRPPMTANDFLNGEGLAYVITTEQVMERWDIRPDDLEVVAATPYFLKQHRLLLVSRRRTLAAAMDRPAEQTAARRDDATKSR